MVSGLKIKFSKSKLFGVGVGVEEVQEWASGLGCGSGTLPFIYLGLPVGAATNRIDNWKVVVEKMKNILASWKAKVMSFGGRLTLVKSVL